MSFSKFTQEDFDLINAEYASLREDARKRCADEEEFNLVQKAFDFANEAHKNIRRRSGEPYMIHPINVAKIVVEDVGLGCKSICAALLHDVVEDTEYTTEDIRNLFGEKIASLVDGLTKIKTVLDNEDKSGSPSIYAESMQAENFKRILLTLNDDVRVVLIKLADRLHNCRTIEYMPEHKRDKILSETMFIFIPLAHRLGLYEVKSEMENIWLKYKEPDAYNEICKKIELNVKDRELEIDNFIKPIDEALTAAGFKYRILKRIKTPYSIWHKMQTKNVTFDQVYDLYAVRIIFDSDKSTSDTERDQCYHIFSIATSIYRYQPSRIRDWVMHPKSNGYEALHCTLMSQGGIWVEVQIRSRRMDDIAERGIAAHWAYKNEGFISENDSEMDKWLAQIKDILVQKDFSALELLDIFHSDLTGKEIVVFTPKGEQRTVKNGSTALDFAYQIHSHIGNSAIAAKVNMKLVPLSHEIKSGDQVEIITAGTGKPKKEWLKFLKTRHAINCVMDYFKGDRDNLILEGASMVRSALAKAGKRVNNENLKRILQATQVLYVDELYFRVALGVVNTEEFAGMIENTEELPRGDCMTARDSEGNRYIIAPCCSPIPGDPVIGFKNPDGTITVHKKSCHVAEELASKHGERVVVPKFGKTDTQTGFPVRLVIKGFDRVGLLNDITHSISLVFEANMRKIMLTCDEGIIEGYIEIYIHGKKALEDMIANLSHIDGVQDVIRTDI